MDIKKQQIKAFKQGYQTMLIGLSYLECGFKLKGMSRLTSANEIFKAAMAMDALPLLPGTTSQAEFNMNAADKFQPHVN